MVSQNVAQLMPPAMNVSVTQDEIDSAVPANSGHCMIADAVKRDFQRKFKRKPLGVSVDLQTIRLTDCEKGLRFVYLTPPTAQRALLQFDQGKKLTPFNFRLSAGQTVESRASTKTIEDKQKLGRSKKGREKLAKARLKKARLAKAKKSLNGRAKVVLVDGKHRGQTQIKLGGRVPPASVLTGNRRQYGIKALGDLNGPTGAVKPRRKTT